MGERESSKSAFDQENEFVWTIENFLYWPLPPKKALLSPYFRCNNLDSTDWQLELYPRGDEDPEYVALYLRRRDTDAGPKKCEARSDIGIYDRNHRRVNKRNKCLDFKPKGYFGSSQFISREDLISRQDDLLPDNTLTVFALLYPIEYTRPIELSMSSQFDTERLRLELDLAKMAVTNSPGSTMRVPSRICPMDLEVSGIGDVFRISLRPAMDGIPSQDGSTATLDVYVDVEVAIEEKVHCTLSRFFSNKENDKLTFPEIRKADLTDGVARVRLTVVDPKVIRKETERKTQGAIRAEVEKPDPHKLLLPRWKEGGDIRVRGEDDIHFMAHTVVLVARSEVLRRVLRQPDWTPLLKGEKELGEDNLSVPPGLSVTRRPGKHPLLQLWNASAGAVVEVLHCAYYDSFSLANVEMKLAKELFKIGHLLQFPQLCNLSLNRLIREISAYNVWDLLRFADEMMEEGCELLHRRCCEFAWRSQLILSDDWPEFVRSNPTLANTVLAAFRELDE